MGYWKAISPIRPIRPIRLIKSCVVYDKEG